MDQVNKSAILEFVGSFLKKYLEERSYDSIEPLLSEDFTCGGLLSVLSEDFIDYKACLKNSILHNFSKHHYRMLTFVEKPISYDRILCVFTIEFMTSIRGLEQPPQLMSFTMIVQTHQEQFLLEHLHQSTLANHNNRHHLAQMAVDQLTGLYNNWKFNEILEDFLNQNRRYYVQAVLLMIDVDHFTEINETLGEDEGDRILSEIASAVKKRLRTTDYIGRWEGEKFIVLMPHTNYKDGLTTAETIRRMVAHTNFGLHRSLTISIGISGVEMVESVEHWIEMANDLLIQAKSQGRNRVVGASVNRV